MQKVPRFTLDHDTQQKFYISFFGCLSLTSKQPKILQSIFFHLSHLQYICISIWIQVHLFSTTGDHPFTYYVRRVAEIANLREICSDNFESWAYSFVWILLWIYFGAFLICWVFSAFYSRNVEINKKFNLLHIIFQLFARAHFSIFFWIINMIIMVPFLNQVQDKKLYIGLQASSSELSAMNAILMVLNYIIGGITALFCYHSFHGESSFAARTPSLQFLTFFSKAIITPLITSGDENREGKEVVLIIFSVILALVKLGVLYKEFPYYEFFTMKIVITWKSIAAWLSIMNALILIFIGDVLDWDLNPIIFLNLIPLPIIVKTAISIFKKIVETYQMKSPFGLINEDMVYKKILAFHHGQRDIQLSLQSQQKHNLTDLKFYGKLHLHSKICKDPSCICDALLKRDSIGQQSIADLQASLEKYFSERFLEVLSNSLPNMKKNDHVKLSLACILIDLDKGELLKGLGYLFSISEQQSSLFVKIRRHVLLRKAQAKIDQNSNKKIFGDFDMKKVMTFYIKKQQFTDLVLSNSQKYIDFWSFYNTPNFDILDLLHKSENLETEAEKIERFWNSSVTKYPEFYSTSIDLYYLYLKLVRNKPFTASKIAKKFLLLKKISSDSPGFTQENLYCHDTMILKVTMSKEKLGKVLYASSNIQYVLGFQPSELIEKNINTIMPSSFREPHNQILEKYLLHEKNKKHQYVSINSYILNKKHYVVPCSLYVTVTPFLQNELTFLGALRISQKTTTDQIIITEDGLIDGTTEKVGKFLNIPLTKSVHLTEICYYSQTHLQSTENKKIKWLSLVDRLTNECLTPKDVFSPSESPRGRGRERFTTKIDYNTGSLTKPNWGALFMIRKHFLNEDELQEEHIEYQAKLTTQTMNDRKFYVMSLKRANNKIKSINVKTLTKSKAIDDLLNSYEVPEEGTGSNNSHPLVSPLTLTTSRHLSPQKIKPPSILTTARNETSRTERGKLLFEGPSSSPDYQPLATSIFAFNNNNGSPRRRTAAAETDHGLIGSAQTRGISMGMESVEQEDTGDLYEGEPLGLAIFDKKEKQSLKYSGKASSTTSAGNELPKLEEAVYSVPQNKFERYAKVVGVFSSAVCLSLLYLYVFNLQDNFTSIKGNTDMLNIASFRLNRLLELKRGTSLMALFKNGIIDNDRFLVDGVQNFIRNVLYVISEEQKDLLLANNQLRKYINETETKLQQEFFDNLVPMKLSNDNDDLIYLNTFDAANELLTRMARVSKLASSFTTGSSDVDFIDNNVLDEMLLSSEDIYSILVQDNNQNITKTRNIGISLMITVLMIGFVLFWFFILRLRASFKFRDDLLSIFLRLDENAINHNVSRVKNLITSLTISNIQLNDFRTQNLDTEPRSKTKKELDAEAASQGLRMRLKKASFKKNHQIVIRIIILKIIALLMLIFPFAQILITMENKSTIIKSNINTIIDVNNALYEIVLIYVSLYGYIFTNGDMTLRTRPIDSEWEAVYTKRMSTADFFSNLLIKTQQDETMSEENKVYISELINGNLCDVMPKKVGQQLCTFVSQGFLTKGIQSISIYTLNVLRRVKDQYDNSARTTADVKSAIGLKALVDVELSVWQWQYEAYLEIGRVYGRWTTSSIDETGDLLIHLMIFYIFWYLLAVSYYSYKVDVFIGNKTKGWKRLCRKIPIDVTVSVKQLKIYLFRTSGTAYRNL